MVSYQYSSAGSSMDSRTSIISSGLLGVSLALLSYNDLPTYKIASSKEPNYV